MVEQIGNINIQDYLQILYRRIWYIIIPFVFSVGAAIALCYLLPKSYRSSTLILVEQQKVPDAYVKSSVSSSIEDRLGTIREQITSRTLLLKIIDEFGLYKKEAQKKPSPDEIVEKMRKHIEIKIERGGRNIDGFSLTYEGEDPYLVMQVANKLTSLFIEENLKVREEFISGTTLFLDKEMEEVKIELERQEKKIQEFKQRYMGELPEQQSANLQTLARLQLELQATDEGLSRANEQRAIMQDQGSQFSFLAEVGVVPGGEDVALPDQIRLKQLEAELNNLRTHFTDKHPEVIQKKNEIARIKSQMKAGQAEVKKDPSLGQTSKPSLSSEVSMLNAQLEELNQEIARLKTKRKSLEKQVTEYQTRVENVPLREQQAVALLRDYENTKRHYQSLLDKKLNAKISENLEKRQKGEQFRILDPANLPTKPHKPDQKKILLLGLLIGLGAGVGLAYMRELTDISFTRPEELEAALQLPVLAAIPNISIALKKERKAG